MSHKISSAEDKASVRPSLARFCIRNPHFVIVPCLIVTLLGVLALLELPKDLLPAANLPAVQILSFYSGMPVDQIASSITERFEVYTGRAIGLERQESRSLLGVSTVKNFFNSSMDLNTAISQTTALVMSVLRKLPPGAQPPLILPFDPMGAVPLALVAVNGDLPVDKLNDLGRYEVENAVQAVPGAMAPTVMGGTERQIIVFLKPDQLRRYNLSPLDVLSTLTSFNTFIPSGDIKMDSHDYQILGNGLVDKVSEMNDFPVRAENGVDVLLKQVGEAKDSHTIQTNIVRVDGKEQVYVPIYRQPGANSIAVIDQIRLGVKDLQERLGDKIKNFKLTVVADQSAFIRHAIQSISEEAAIGGGLAALMVFLFLGNPRATGGILLSLPLSLLCAFLGLKAAGETLNAMTLGGLALSIGVLVDNSIVVLENIIQKIASGMDPFTAAAVGASEVMGPVLSATLATLVVFFPVVMLGGVTKVLFAALAKSVIFAMIGSFLVASTVIPLFSAYCLRAPEAKPRKNILTSIEEGLHHLAAFYGKALSLALKWRYGVLVTVVIILIAASGLALRIGTELFPRADAGSFIVNARLPSGTRIEITDKVSQDIEKKIRQWIPAEDLSMVISNAGLIYGFPAAFTQNSGTQDVFFNIELTAHRQHSSQYYAKVIREGMKKDFPQVEIGVQLGGLLTSALNGGLLSPIDVQFEGADEGVAAKLAADLAEKMKSVRGAVDVRVQQRMDTPQIQLNVDRKTSREMGLTADEVMKNVVSAVSGSSTFNPTIWVDPKSGNDYFLGVQVPETSIQNMKDLKDLPITGRHQERVVSLSSLAQFKNSQGPSEINHVNLRSVIDVYADAQDRDIGGVSGDVQKLIDQMHLPPGYHAVIRGEFATMNEAVHSLGGGFLLAVILVYLILVMQFRSFLWPAIILLAVPMGMVGIIVMLALTNTYFSIQAAIGAIFMIGIAVANGVLLIEFILHHINDGKNVEAAIVSGAQARLRPILMTSLASMLGLVPMAVGLGHGSEANIPLGRAVIGGQLLSTTLTLFVVPLLFRILYRKPGPRAPVAVKNLIPTGPLILGFVLLVMMTSFSPKAQATSLREILESAEAVDGKIAAGKTEQVITEAQVKVAKADYYPHLEADAIETPGFSGSSSVMGISGVLGSPFRSGPGVEALASMTLWDFGRTSSKVHSAEYQQKSEGAKLEVVRGDVDLAAVQIYFECVRNRSLLSNWNFILRQAQAIDHEVQNFVTTGQHSVVDKYLSESQVEKALTEKMDAQTRLQSSRQRLAILTTLQEKDLTCPEVAEISDKDLNFLSEPGQNPALVYREQQIHVASAELDQAHADFMPKLKAFASYGYYDKAQLIPREDYAYGVAVSWPLFDGMKTVHETEAARSAVTQQQQLQSDVRYEIDQKNAKLDQDIAASVERLSHLEKAQRIALHGFHVAKDRYFHSRGNLIDLRESLNTLASTQNDFTETQIRLQLTRVGKKLINGWRISSAQEEK